ncbi:hypothetical protein TW78_22180 [Vibrio coralliilyticus]|uniref:Uncharacterized protein n=1 Tax=Vibrio coralliilyticus TaxID=190893 RepID=A0A837G8W8_9VIBR|nr:hypothetical protein N779_21155 [Vibrio coralliilyticus OCN008]KJY67748.1 hypothetical protein TW78_22180 [Vibrio coralliilyticus]
MIIVQTFLLCKANKNDRKANLYDHKANKNDHKANLYDHKANFFVVYFLNSFLKSISWKLYSFIV